MSQMPEQQGSNHETDSDIDKETDRKAEVELAIPHIETPSESRHSLSLAWLVPLFAAGLAIWLAYNHYAEKGPLINLRFNSAESIEAGVTRVKYKDMEIGEVKSIRLADDLDGVIVSVQMIKDASPWLTDKTRFWVVRPQIGLAGVSGLGTLFSGAYIQADVVLEGTPTLHFVGLENPPLTESNAPGLRLTLKAKQAGSVNIGSPVYFRQIAVGQVEARAFSDDYQGVEFSVFIRAPHHRQINSQTRFWNVSGVEASLSSEGIELRTASLEALLAGGIAFESLSGVKNQEKVTNGAEFPLFDNEKAAREHYYAEQITHSITSVLYFRESVRGLKAGAPVEYFGVPVGQVIDVDLRYDEGIDQAYIPVLIELQPERIGLGNSGEYDILLKNAVLFGLRAQLQTGNLLTGQLFVALRVMPDAEEPQFLGKDPYPEIPTIATELNQLTDKAYAALDRLNQLPLEALLANAIKTVAAARALVETPETQAIPGNINKALSQVRGTLVALNGLSAQLKASLKDASQVMGGVDPDSPLYYEATTTLRSIQEATASMQALLEALERNPAALLLGE